MPSPETKSRVIGIDVGGARKGFHAVMLDGTRSLKKLHTRDPDALARWCLEQAAQVVAVDAPCRWRGAGLARLAERQLAAAGMACYYAPTEERAREHAFYQWMLPGAALYVALQPHFPLYLGDATTGPVSIETFPHAVACALAGHVVSAKKKRDVRGALLVRAGIDTSELTIIDEIDATLCAWAAACFAEGAFTAYGDKTDGFMIVPSIVLRANATR